MRAKWMRGVAIFYGCLTLLLLGVVAIIKPSSITPNGFTDRKVWAAESRSAQVSKPTCPGKRNESCTGEPNGE